MDEHKHSPAIRYSNKVLYTMYKTTDRRHSDVAVVIGFRNSTNFKLVSLGMRGAQERALFVSNNNIGKLYHNLDENNSSTQQVQTGVQHYVYTKVQYSTSTDWCTPPAYILYTGTT